MTKQDRVWGAFAIILALVVSLMIGAIGIAFTAWVDGRLDHIGNTGVE